MNRRRRDLAATRTWGWSTTCLPADALETLGDGHHGRGPCALRHDRHRDPRQRPAAGGQPLSRAHMALAHNGNLTNALSCASELELKRRHLSMTTSDTEVIAYIITQQRTAGQAPLRRPSARSYGRHQGCVFAGDHVAPRKLIAARDPNGFRPAVHGQDGRGHRVFAVGILRAGRHRRDLRAGRRARRDGGGHPRTGVHRAIQPEEAGESHLACSSTSILRGRIPSSTAARVHEARGSGGRVPCAGSSRTGGRGHRRAGQRH